MRRKGFLFEDIASFTNLIQAARLALKGKRRKPDAAWFFFHLENQLLDIQTELREGRYQPSPYHIFLITDPKPRRIAAVPFRDRVVHHALCRVIGPILERGLIHDVYACRLGKGTHAATARAQAFSRKARFYLKCDIRKYFESIDHEILKRMLARLIKDPRVTALLERIIDHAMPGVETAKGLPIGNLTSQYFANMYLGPLDHFLKEALRIKKYLRYMDDFLLFSDDKNQLQEALCRIRAFLGRRLDLTLKEKAVVIATVAQGVPFLGFRIYPRTIRMQREKWVRFRKRIRQLERSYLEGAIEEDRLAASVGAMVGHIQHADSLVARRKFFMGSSSLG